MESEQVVKKNKSAWKMLFVGFLLGLLASFLVLVIIAFKYGPQGESTSVDLYSGHAKTRKFFLWKKSDITEPNSPHVQWAIKHQNPVRKWYMPAASVSRPVWFGKMRAVSYNTREYICKIYSLQIPEEEKIKLLHQYHKELDALMLKNREMQEEISKLIPVTKPLYEEWDQKLEKIKNDEK